MLTPRDIHRAEFKKVWKGYSPDEVDAFLERVVVAYERIFKENQELKERMEEMEARLSEYSTTEVKLSQTLEMAKQTALDVKSAAEREARAILATAQGEADEIKRSANAWAQDQRRKVDAYLWDVQRYRGLLEEAVDQLRLRLRQGDELQLDVEYEDLVEDQEIETPREAAAAVEGEPEDHSDSER